MTRCTAYILLRRAEGDTECRQIILSLSGWCDRCLFLSVYAAQQGTTDTTAAAAGRSRRESRGSWCWRRRCGDGTVTPRPLIKHCRALPLPPAPHTPPPTPPPILGHPGVCNKTGFLSRQKLLTWRQGIDGKTTGLLRGGGGERLVYND